MLPTQYIRGCHRKPTVNRVCIFEAGTDCDEGLPDSALVGIKGADSWSSQSVRPICELKKIKFVGLASDSPRRTVNIPVLATAVPTVCILKITSRRPRSSMLFEINLK